MVLPLRFSDRLPYLRIGKHTVAIATFGYTSNYELNRAFGFENDNNGNDSSTYYNIGP